MSIGLCIYTILSCRLEKAVRSGGFSFIYQALNRVCVMCLYQSHFRAVTRTIPDEILYFTRN